MSHNPQVAPLKSTDAPGLHVARPVAAAVLIALCWVAVTTIGFVIATTAMPGAERQLRALAALAGASLLAAVVLRARGWWHAAGFTPVRSWRNPWVLAVPVVIVTAPLLGGVRTDLDVAGAVVLLIGYLLTGFAEETVFRGILLRVLSPRGMRSAVLISSLLFGVAHLANLVIRGNPAIVAAQAVGAFTSGIGYAAVYVCTGTIWAAIAVHFLHDMFLHLSGWPVIVVDVVQDIALVTYGVYLLWFRTPSTPAHDPPGTDASRDTRVPTTMPGSSS